MDKSGANAFVFAKANGILGKSFVNERAQQLFGQKSLSDLWTLIFQTQPPLVPDVVPDGVAAVFVCAVLSVELISRFLRQ